MEFPPVRFRLPPLPSFPPSASPVPTSLRGRLCFSYTTIGLCEIRCTLTSRCMECTVRASPREVGAAACRLREGIDSVLSGWHGLRLAVDNEWGGRDSARKYFHLADDILSWFYLSGGDVCVEELENFLHESMLLIFNTEIEDGSIEEVAEQLMILQEEYYYSQMSREQLVTFGAARG